jgi:hypothetical protein
LSSSLNPATEARIRESIARGDHRSALEDAKAAHKLCGTAASEALLVDAYAERIRSLSRRNLTVEAKSLFDFVRQRYASARTRLDGLMASTGDRPILLEDLIRPLNEPDVPAERRNAIEQAIKRDISNLTALAGCEALAAGHPLREAASALARAFDAVTSGPVADDALALPEVSRRSALAPWKPLVRAIASFHRGDDDACRRHLNTIETDSVPARLVPVIRAMLDRKEVSLTPAAAVLKAQVTRRSALETVLRDLDKAFESGQRRPILKAVRASVQECQRSSPDRTDALKQRISVRCAMAGFREKLKVIDDALGGPSLHDATFFRLFARGMEETRDVDDVVLACKGWEAFRQAAVQEGWFAGNGLEAAALALHVASLIGNVPEQLLRDLQHSARTRAAGEDLTFLFPEKLYRRACVLDPHPESFAQWMEWAASHRPSEVEEVARAWHKIRARDIEPLLRLLNVTERRGALTAALGWLARLECLDPHHPVIRRLRFRLLSGRVLQQVEKKKHPTAESELITLAALPDAAQGDHPAFLAAVRVLMAAARDRPDEAARARVELERNLGHAPAMLLFFAVATTAKQRAIARLDPPSRLAAADRRALPEAVARIWRLSAELRLKFELPWAWIAETSRQFPHVRERLDVDQLIAVGEVALAGGHDALGYAASAEGLARQGSTDARFLFLRARSVIDDATRHAVCAKAAAELARHTQDMELVEHCVELVREFVEFNQLNLTLAQARDVLERERGAAEPRSRQRCGPDYRDLLPLCQCVDCRRKRGEIVEPFYSDPDDDLDELDFPLELPPDMPLSVAARLMREAEEAFRRGESLDQFTSRILEGERRGKRRTER